MYIVAAVAAAATISEVGRLKVIYSQTNRVMSKSSLIGIGSIIIWNCEMMMEYPKVNAAIEWQRERERKRALRKGLDRKETESKIAESLIQGKTVYALLSG